MTTPVRRKTSIRLKDLSLTFPDGTTAIRNVSLDINSGETMALVGPSGCGKTSTLRIIGGLETKYYRGEVWFDDRRMDGIPTEMRNTGIVFQNYALFPNMNVFGNVAFGLKVRGLAKQEIERKVSDALSLVQISGLKHRMVTELSGGQRQRVALARALAIEPDILLLDEPLTALDAKLRDQLRIELDTLLKTLQITTVFVTHDQAEAMSLGHRIAVMKDGNICQVGTPMEIYKKPKELFVATFIGTNNALKGSVVREKGEFTFRKDGFSLPLMRGQATSPGDNVWILFRPEDVLPSAPDRAHFAATVKNIFFLGEKTRLICSICTKEEIIVDLKEYDHAAVGKEILLEVPPQKVYITRE